MLALESSAKISTSFKSSWPHLNANTVMNRLDELRKNPHLIYQGALGLCGEATFFYHVIPRNRFGFVAMGQVLLMDGVCVVGKLLINPDSDLLNADYPAIVTEQKAKVLLDPRVVHVPPQADWMLLSALRDSQNEILDFEGRPDETSADGSEFQERADWYEKSGLYETVVADSDTSLPHIKATVKKAPNNHIALRIKAAMIKPGATGNHVISLETPITFRSDVDLVEFRYWSWGRDPLDQRNYVNLTNAEFINNYLGVIIATF